jgi:hypothetical protein
LIFIFCDISKAFDRVWHTEPLCKLRKIGIDENLLSWVAEYLDDKKQKVVLDRFSLTSYEYEISLSKAYLQLVYNFVHRLLHTKMYHQQRV